MACERIAVERGRCSNTLSMAAHTSRAPMSASQQMHARLCMDHLLERRSAGVLLRGELHGQKRRRGERAFSILYASIKAVMHHDWHIMSFMMPKSKVYSETQISARCASLVCNVVLLEHRPAPSSVDPSCQHTSFATRLCFVSRRRGHQHASSRIPCSWVRLELSIVHRLDLKPVIGGISIILYRHELHPTIVTLAPCRACSGAKLRPRESLLSRQNEPFMLASHIQSSVVAV